MGYRKLAMPDKAQLAQMLKPTIFKSLDSSSLDSLAEMLEYCQCDQGECVRECGDEKYALYIITSGSVCMTFPSSADAFTKLGAGESFGILSILFKCESGLDVYASEQTNYLMLDAATLRMLEVSNPQLALALIRAMRNHIAPLISKTIPIVAKLVM